jgi:hypothetical protein
MNKAFAKRKRGFEGGWLVAYTKYTLIEFCFGLFPFVFYHKDFPEDDSFAETKSDSFKASTASRRKSGNVDNWWAGPDLNRRPLARKANVLTKLDDRPPKLAYFF